MRFRRCGRSGLQLPLLSLGLWHNFGGDDDRETARTVARRAFDRGITQFDLANNYGPPPGSAETTFGRILDQDLRPFRDELVITTKAGYTMWPGPYGDWGSRKHLLASLDQSLRRMGLDHVDIFYSHRPDPSTPIEETMGALDSAVRQGKALYAGLSNYPPAETRHAIEVLRRLGTPCIVHQPAYSIANRRIEQGLLDTLEQIGLGCVVFSPLAQGLLTGKYLGQVPAESRAGRTKGSLNANLTPATLERIERLDRIARRRGQSLAQMALAWVLRDTRITSAIIGARTVAQLDDCLGALRAPPFEIEELAEIDAEASLDGADLWKLPQPR